MIAITELVKKRPLTPTLSHRERELIAPALMEERR
jgi:hypothetical protein